MKLLFLFSTICSAFPYSSPEPRCIMDFYTKWQDCQSACRLFYWNSNACYYWHYDTAAQICYTKNKSGWEKVADVNSVSGDKDGRQVWHGYKLEGGAANCP